MYPETEPAGVLGEEWILADDCPSWGPGRWRSRPEVRTGDPRLVLAGDGIRCDLPVALMERAATTGWQAANALLESWGVRGHDIWSVPMRSRVPGVPDAAPAGQLTGPGFAVRVAGGTGGPGGPATRMRAAVVALRQVGTRTRVANTS